MTGAARAGAIRQLRSQPALAVLVRCAPPEMQARVPESLQRIFDVLDAAGVESAGPAYTRYLGHFPDEGLFELEVGVPVRDAVSGSGDVRTCQLPGGRAFCLWHEGPYESLGSSFELLNRLLGENGLVATSPPWEAYVVTRSTEPDPQKWRTELCQPIEDKP